MQAEIIIMTKRYDTIGKVIDGNLAEFNPENNYLGVETDEGTIYVNSMALYKEAGTPEKQYAFALEVAKVADKVQAENSRENGQADLNMYVTACNYHNVFYPYDWTVTRTFREVTNLAEFGEAEAMAAYNREIIALPWLIRDAINWEKVGDASLNKYAYCEFGNGWLIWK